MIRKFVLCLCALLFSAVMAAAQDTPEDKPKSANQEKQQEVNQDDQADAKKLSGMSIVGNEDAPKSLYIVPWKSAEIGAETSMDMMLNEGDTPVDRDVFKRQVEFYKVSKQK